ncbi:MAG: hypothetical protein MUC87_19025 [Bacteroidia bacterium]|jgi:hypothetical protein|nr:hypothetical protein [Bacteroidia bacterium]
MKNRKTIWAVVAVILVAAAVSYWLMQRPVPRMSAAIDSMNGSHYALDLPSTMNPASFNDNASLQYADPSGELYVMVIDESKEKIASFGLDYDLDTYMKIALRKLDSTGLYRTTTRALGNFKALQTEVKAKFKGQGMTYQLTAIESETSFYQVLIWTLDSRYETNKAEMERILASFRETKTAQNGGEKKPDSLK